MIDPLSFTLGALALLLTPGPTNTLLATSGAASGWRRALPLLWGELGGYMTAISILILAFGPVLAAVPLLGQALGMAVAVYLLHLACKLWRDCPGALAHGEPVGVGRVFVTTLLNPKALIFAFTLLPPAEAGAEALLPALAGLAVMIAGAGAGWIAIGAVLRQGLDAAEGPRTARRAGAVALLGFAGLISARVAGFA